MSGIIAFYSRAGENYVSGEIKALTVGNTEVAANALQKIIKADLESYRLDGKVIIPFATSGGSPIGNTNAELEASCKGQIYGKAGALM